MHPYEKSLEEKEKTIKLLRRQLRIAMQLLESSEKERQTFVRNVCSCGFDSADVNVHKLSCDYRQLFERRLRRGKTPTLIDELENGDEEA